ncbi:MAG: hypothetical protein HY319_30850 [Armatimonadetes bacterium]|nr:hypothetical protein [Armatimonadota bacterium]
MLITASLFTPEGSPYAPAEAPEEQRSWFEEEVRAAVDSIKAPPRPVTVVFQVQLSEDPSVKAGTHVQVCSVLAEELAYGQLVFVRRLGVPVMRRFLRKTEIGGAPYLVLTRRRGELEVLPACSLLGAIHGGEAPSGLVRRMLDRLTDYGTRSLLSRLSRAGTVQVTAVL